MHVDQWNRPNLDAQMPQVRLTPFSYTCVFSYMRLSAPTHWQTWTTGIPN